MSRIWRRKPWSTRLREDLGGGSLTALLIIETEAQNISAYIPTNLISITDGQICLSPSPFELGVLPAVDVGQFVSSVGDKAQPAAYRAVAGDLPEDLSERLVSADSLREEDRQANVNIGRRALARFQPQPDPAPELGG